MGGKIRTAAARFCRDSFTTRLRLWVHKDSMLLEHLSNFMLSMDEFTQRTSFFHKIMAVGGKFKVSICVRSPGLATPGGSRGCQTIRMPCYRHFHADHISVQELPHRL